jgi:hypothetical protein
MTSNPLLQVLKKHGLNERVLLKWRQEVRTTKDANCQQAVLFCAEGATISFGDDIATSSRWSFIVHGHSPGLSNLDR